MIESTQRTVGLPESQLDFLRRFTTSALVPIFSVSSSTARISSMLTKIVCMPDLEDSNSAEVNKEERDGPNGFIDLSVGSVDALTHDEYGQSSTMAAPLTQDGYANSTMSTIANNVYWQPSTMASPLIQDGYANASMPTFSSDVYG